MLSESIGARADRLMQPTSQSTRGFRLLRADQLEFTPPQWLVRDHIEADSLALAFGDPASGKSFYAVSLACCVATGHRWYGHKVKAGPVVYVAGEGHNGLRRRMSAWEHEVGASLTDAPLFISTAPAALCDPASIADVLAAIADVKSQGEPPALVVIDTVARNFGPGDENSTRDMGAFIQAADTIRTQYGCTILLIHHTGHTDKGRARGAMALKGALDAEYRLDKDDDGVVRLEATKMKDASLPGPLAFRLQGVGLGVFDDEGVEATSAVLALTEYHPKKPKSGPGKWQVVAIEKLEGLHREERENAIESGRDPNVASVPLEAWRAACQDAGMPRQRFSEAKRSPAVRIEHGFVALS